MAANYEAQHGAGRAQDGMPWPSPPDPGDLSRRIALRRAELKLTRYQVASRAGLSLRYLEYLERYAGRPTGPALRRLAAALQTSPPALLGAGLEAPPGSHRLIHRGTLERLPPAECARLLAPGGIGRIAFPAASGIVVLPVNYGMLASTIVLRASAGSLIAAHADGEVSFEVDHLDEALEQAWSVLVQGQAHRVGQRMELAQLERAAPVLPWPGGAHDVYVRILPSRITGRRIAQR